MAKDNIVENIEIEDKEICPDCTDGYNRNPLWKVGDSGHYEWTCTTCNGTQKIDRSNYGNVTKNERRN